jgi:hypothetical protein
MLLGVVMMSKVLLPAAIAAALFTGTANAQEVGAIGGPRELPPADYTQQQYVDSRGCVFLRAGLGGTVRWVPRVGPDRAALCNATPTFKQAQQAAAALDADTAEPTAPATVAAAAAPAPAPVMPAPAATARAPAQPALAAAPSRTPSPAPAPTRVSRVEAPLPSPITNPAPAAPLTVATRPAATAVVPTLPTAAATGDRIACFKSAPVLTRVALSDGGSALVCTTGDGSLNGWRSPIFPGERRVGAALSPAPGVPAPSVADSAVPQTTVPTAPRTATAPRPAAPGAAEGGLRVMAGIPVPPGYTPSWKDDRLNPMRGLGTVQGQAQQDAIWTRSLPAELVASPPPGRVLPFIGSLVAPAHGPNPAAGGLVVSSKNEATAPVQAPRGAAYVQVGAFKQPANAEAAIARLAAAGLPVSSQAGRGLKVILAGPFASAAEAAQALSIARSAGFSEAFLK